MKLANEAHVLECYEKYRDTVYKLAYSYCRNKEQSEDVFQDVFCKYMSHVPRFRDENHAKAWFIRTTVNTCKNLLKLKWNRDRVPYEENMSNDPAMPEEHEYAVLQQAILALPDKYRVPIHLYYYEEYSIREIAQILHRTESSIQTQLQRGREKIRRFLEEKGVHYEIES